MTITVAARQPHRKKQKAPALHDEMAASRDVKNRVHITLYGGKYRKKATIADEKKKKLKISVFGEKRCAKRNHSAAEGIMQIFPRTCAEDDDTKDVSSPSRYVVVQLSASTWFTRVGTLLVHTLVIEVLPTCVSKDD